MELVISFASGAVFSAVFSYLFLRANPVKKAVLDAWVNEQSARLKQ